MKTLCVPGVYYHGSLGDLGNGGMQGHRRHLEAETKPSISVAVLVLVLNYGSQSLSLSLDFHNL
jgi:hypothetical protein